MRAASENLTQVTLELGGKSPAIVMRDYPLADAAKRITHGKTTNCGQICVSPDYALVPRENVGDFVTAVRSCFLKMFGSDVSDSPDYSWIVNDRHCARVSGLLADAREKAATVVPCADYDVSPNSRQMPLHIVTNSTSKIPIMNDELSLPI